MSATPREDTVEQRARDLLERAGVEHAQSFSAGDVVEIANLLVKFDALLAVAKQAAEATAAGWAPGQKWKVDTAVVALYAQHPKWLEWAP